MTSTFSMEPMLPSDAAIDKSSLPNLMLELERKAAMLSGMIKPVTSAVLEEHMQVINAYYSNLMEGNSTQPRDIRKAMRGDYDADSIKRNFQLESLAHVNAQRQIGEIDVSDVYLLSEQCFLDIHRILNSEIPKSLCKVASESDESLVVVPGRFRTVDVQLGWRAPPSNDDIFLYIKRFSDAYRLDWFRGQKQLVAGISAHHRFAPSAVSTL